MTTTTPVPTTTTPEPSETTSQLSDALNTVTTPCRPGDGSMCGFLNDLTGNESFARYFDGIASGALKVLVILVVGFLVRFVLIRLISKLSERIATGDIGNRSRRGTHQGAARARATALLEASPLAGERRGQRARTIGSVLRSITTGVVAIIVLLMVLGEFGINVGPLIAGAGVLGVALGFGSQTLVKDFLSGIFMIVEDQYGVGDVVDLGEATGSVEAVALRVTRLRSVDGTVWYVRNGEILRVGNQSQGWARAVMDIAVGYGEDVSEVQELLRQVGASLQADPDWGPLVLEDPEVWGVEALSADSVVVRLVVKTVPLEQWTVARELRRRIKASFDAHGIEMPFPQRTVWMRDADDAPHHASEKAAAAHAAGAAPGTEGGPAPVPQGESAVVADADPEDPRA